jgi:hypothetical protein
VFYASSPEQGWPSHAVKILENPPDVCSGQRTEPGNKVAGLNIGGVVKIIEISLRTHTLFPSINMRYDKYGKEKENGWQTNTVLL